MSDKEYYGLPVPVVPKSYAEGLEKENGKLKKMLGAAAELVSMLSGGNVDAEEAMEEIESFSEHG